MKQKTAVIYARVSTIKQADDGISMDSQVELGHKKAEELKASVVRVFRDDGFSGRSANRPDFQQALTYCDLHKVDYFIVWSTSRFARNKVDAASLKILLRESGTKVVYVSIDIDTETDEGWFSESLLEIMDEHYSRQISKDTTRSMLKNARDGYFNGGHIPFGYQTIEVGKRKKLAIKENEASIVKQLFDYYQKGDGCVMIARQMNDKGLLFRGKRWTKGQVSLILKNPVYTGYVVFNRKNKNGKINPKSEWIMTKSHEAIVSEADFNTVQETFESRDNGNLGSPLSQFIFTGLLKCGACGASLHTENATGRNKKYYYYNCSRARKGQGCTHRRIPAPELDQWLLDNVLSMMLTPELMLDVVTEVETLGSQYLADRSKQISAAQTELKKVKHAKKKVMDTFEEFGKEAPGFKELVERLNELSLQEKHLMDTLVELDTPLELEPFSRVEVVQATNELIKIIKECEDPKRVRTLLQHFIEKIVLTEDAAEFYYRPEKLLIKKNNEPMVRCSSMWLPDLGSNQGPAD